MKAQQETCQDHQSSHKIETGGVTLRESVGVPAADSIADGEGTLRKSEAGVETNEPTYAAKNCLHDDFDGTKCPISSIVGHRNTLSMQGHTSFMCLNSSLTLNARVDK
jgi:hypothetical protein